MKQFTTKWAKEYLNNNPHALCVYQNYYLEVWQELLDYNQELHSSLIGDMLKHSDGLKNSKVTREDLCD